MKKPTKWGPADIRALRQLIKRTGSQRAAAAALGTAEGSVGRWVLGREPRNPSAARAAIDAALHGKWVTS